MGVSLATIVYRLVLLLALVVTTYLAVVPAPITEGVEISDKFLHAMAFCVLLWLADSSWPDSGVNLAKVTLIFAYGALIEITQFYLPYRECSLLDLLADGVGMLGYPLMIPLLRYLPVLGRRWQG